MEATRHRKSDIESLEGMQGEVEAGIWTQVPNLILLASNLTGPLKIELSTVQIAVKESNGSPRNTNPLT